ncbi:MAG: hypothetical protein CMO82_14410 [Winogradskyella sp.]|uniref:DoxX family membrane protein n=1 Tax=Gelatiniphilus marinus TaxID=1759464 RepID=A0ABW5JSZ8_9FLAO|nr:hypothetical protein [Mangrovimonas yunxiaonensis]MBL87832.1 hypothetical protein [Winogradskyella sp.]|tara:strand:+ start:1568 stop:2005 length:438 start_codon:yes stop_codon:yes gene_type:complete
MYSPTTKVQDIFRIILGAAMVFAAIGHFTFLRVEWQAQVPNWVPMDKNLVVILSGIVELTLGLSMIFLTKYKVHVGWALAIFYVLIFPGNIAQYVNKTDFIITSDTARFVRLLFQPVLVVWALWSTGAWKNRKTIGLRNTNLYKK